MRTILKMKVKAKQELRMHLKKLLKPRITNIALYADGIEQDLIKADRAYGDSIFYEISSFESKSGNPELLDFKTSNFIYDDDDDDEMTA